jgi:hypothetical protein
MISYKYQKKLRKHRRNVHVDEVLQQLFPFLSSCLIVKTACLNNLETCKTYRKITAATAEGNFGVHEKLPFRGLQYFLFNRIYCDEPAGT